MTAFSISVQSGKKHIAWSGVQAASPKFRLISVPLNEAKPWACSSLYWDGVVKVQGKNTVIRADIANAVYREIGLSKTESAELVNSVFRIIEDKLLSNENVKLANFGQFQTRQKTEREARNPKTGEAVTIAPRRVVIFKPSQSFIKRVDSALNKQPEESS